MPDRSRIRIALPILVFLTAAVLITWPLTRQITTHAAGAGYSDSYELIRHIWWTNEALREGHDPFDQPLLVYPHGFHSAIQWTHPFQYIFPALLAFVISPLTAFNLTLLIVLALNGWAAYRLGRYLSGGNTAAALLGGLVFEAFPAMQGHLSAGHIGILWLWPFPLLAECALRLLEDETSRRREIVWGGLWLALGALGYVSQIIFTTFPLLLFGGLYLLLAERHRLIRRGASWRDQPWIALILMTLWGGTILLPFYLPVLIGGGDEIKQISEPGRIAYSTDLLAFVSPSPFGPPDRIAPDYARDVLGTNSIEGTAYLGVIATGLAGIAVLRRRSARLWLAVALGAMLLSLGPLLKWRDQPVTIRIEDHTSHIVLPWAAFENLPLIDATRTPGRFNLITGLALSALASLGAGVVLERVRRREVRIALAAVGGGLILLEYQLFSPFLTVDVSQPDYFRQLASQDDVRAVLDIPTGDNLVAKTALYLQTLHHKPLIAGHVLRRTTQDPALLAVLDRAATTDNADGWAAIRREDVPYLLSQAGADRVVVHKVAYADAQPIVDRLHSIFGPPEFEDARYAVFAIPRVPEPPPGFTLPGAASAAGWSATVEAGPFSGQFLAESGAWYFYSATEQYGDLVFRALPYRTPRRITVWLDDHLITGGWIGADDPQSAGWRVADGTIRVPLRLSPGYHTLRLAAPDGCTDYPFALTCWAASDLSPDCPPLDPPACLSAVFEPPTWEPADAPPTPLDVALDYGLRLTAYEVTPGDHSLRVRLFWDAQNPLPRSYALFVHVANFGTGSPVAQFTGYPPVLTSHWNAGTRWQIDVTIPLPDDLPAGTYAINAGWFHPDDGIRLGVHNGASDNLVHVTRIELK